LGEEILLLALEVLPWVVSQTSFVFEKAGSNPREVGYSPSHVIKAGQ
jgi:hypothetical protein